MNSSAKKNTHTRGPNATLNVQGVPPNTKSGKQTHIHASEANFWWLRFLMIMHRLRVWEDPASLLERACQEYNQPIELFNDLKRILRLHALSQS